MSKTKKIGIMGGTFNPIHMAHLVLAENAYRSFGLDEIIMLPGGNPPHKQGQVIVSAKDRLAMLELAVKDVPYFTVSDMEIRRVGYSYSSVTLQELKEAQPDTEFYFIMGADSVYQIETWHCPADIMANCIILAATRDHTPNDKFLAHIAYLKDCYGADIRLLDTPDLEISSSEIRARVKNHRSVRFMVPEGVCDYIEKHGLYL